MNRNYRLVWNRALRVLQVASELTTSPAGGGAVADGCSALRQRPLVRACAAALALMLAGAALPAWACTPSATQLCGISGGNGGSGNTSGIAGAGGAGAVASGTYANSGGAGGAANQVGTAGQGANGSGGAAGGFGNGIYGTNTSGGGGGGGGLGTQGNGGGGGGGASFGGFSGGGGGGGGGVGQLVSGATFANPGSIYGGNGGNGGNGGFSGSSAYGGGGGGGGAGLYGSSGSVLTSGLGTKIHGGLGGNGGGGFNAAPGGGGGAGVAGAGFSLTNGGSVYGGTGGNGGGSVSDGAYGGAGGAGGIGISGKSLTLTNTGSITGGIGGAGANDTRKGGIGGAGGAGVSVSQTTLTNSGSISGGNGGTGGTNSSGARAGTGNGGIGAIGTGSATIINSGTIAGGLSGDGSTRADAVEFSGTGNTLTLQSGSSLTGNIELTAGAGATIDSQANQSLGSNIVLGNGSALTVDTTSAGLNVTGNISGNGALTMSGVISNSLALSTVNVASLTQNSGSNLTLNGNVTTTGAQTYNDAITLGADVVTASTGSGNITFGSTLNGAHNLTVNTAGIATFGAVGGTTALTSLTTDAGGSTVLDGNVTTTGAQTYNDAVTLGGNVTATSTGGGAIDFASTLDGAHNLNVNTAGNVVFGGAVGGTSALTSLTTTSNTFSAQSLNIGAGGLSVTTLGGPITQIGAFTVTGASSFNAGATNAITLTNTGNDFGGAVTLTGGTTQINDSNDLTLGTLATGALTATSTGTLDLGSGTVSGNLNATSNGGAITQSGALTVTGTSTLYSGNGSIALTNVGNNFQGSVSAAGADVSITDAGNLNIASLLNGANGSVSLIAGGSLTLPTGAISTGTGDLTLASNGGSLTSPGNLSGASISLTGSTGMTLANNVTASGNVTLNSSGTMLLTGDLAAGGTTTIGSGTLQVGNGGTSGSISGNVVDNGTLAFDRSDNVTFAGAISGSGALTQKGVGLLTLTGDSTFTGGTTIAAVSGLQIGNGGTTGSISSDIVDGGLLSFDRSDALTFGGAISGNGSLTQAGSGTLTLDGNSSAFAGSTEVAFGKLIVGSVAGNGAALGGDVNVDSGATLGGHGTIGGNVTVTAGAHLAPGNSIGTLTIGGNAAFAQGSNLDFEFGAPGANFQTAGAGDSVSVGGNLELDGAVLNISDVGGMGPGMYNLFTYGGTLTETNGGLSFGTTPANTQFQIQTLTASKQINLLDTTGMMLNFWNANGQATSTQMGGGTGTWSVTSSNWTDANARVTAMMQPQPGFAIFGGTAGTVTVDDSAGTVAATGMQFASSGYTMQGGTLTLIGTNGNAPIIRVGDGSSAGAGMIATINNVIAGSDGLVKSDLGTLVLAGANTFSGGLTINGGTLSVSSDANLGDASNTLTLNGSTLKNTGSFTTARNVTLQGGGTFQTDGYLTESGVISGSGGLIKTGYATLTLTGDNAFTGGTTINAGTLQIGNGGTTGSIVGDVTDNSALDFNRSDDVTFAGAISGSGYLVQDGSGTLTLTANNTFGGGTYVDNGTLDATNPQALGTGEVDVYGTLNVSGTGTFANAVNNYGTTTVTDSTLGGQTVGNGVANSYTPYGIGNEPVFGNKYTGGQTIAGGTLGFYGHANAGTAFVQNGVNLSGNYAGIGNLNGHKYGGPFGSNANGIITNNVISGGVLSFNGYSSAGSATIHNGVALGGTYGGIGNDDASTTVTGNTLAGGALSFHDHASAGNAVIDNGVTLSGSGSGINNANTGSTITGNTIRGGTITFADSSSAGSATINNGVSFSNGAGVGGIAGALSDVNGNQIMGGTVLFTADSTGSSAFVDNGVGGVLDISGHNGGLSIGEVSGDTGSIIDLGANTLTIGGNNTDDTIGGTIQDGGASGGTGGGLTKTGTGTLTLTGVNTFTGATTISGGTLALTGDSNLADSSGVVDNGTFDISGSNAGSTIKTLSGSGKVTLGAQNLTVANADPATVFGGTIGGSGGVVLSGGDLVLTGANTFTGGTTVTGGTLQIGNGGTSGSIGGDVVDNGALTFDRSDNVIFAGAISGGGSLAQNGTGTLTLDGNSSAFTGSTTVKSGKLAVGDDSHAGASLGGIVTVDAGATLGGIGSIGGLDAFGTVSPGGSIGTLHVAGDATFESGSTFQVEAAPDGTADLLDVTGKVTIKGGNTLVVGQGTGWLPRTDYTIITAGSGVSGQFASVSDNLTFLDPVLTYHPNAVELSLERNDINFNAVADTVNQHATGTGANGLGWNSSLYNVLVFLDPATARAAFDQLSGELHASQQTARADDSRFVREAMDQRLQQGGTGALDAWAHVWGHWGSVDADGNAAKLSDNGDGLLVGADLPVGAQARVGFAGGSSRNSLSVQDRNSWGRLTSDWLGVYGGFDNGPLAFRGGVAYSWDQIPVNRNAEFPGVGERLSSNAIGNTLTGFIEGAWKIHTTAGDFEPYLNLAHVRLSSDATTEVGGDAALHVNSERENVSFSTLGARGNWQFGGTEVHGGIGWQHAFGDTTPQRTMQFVAGGGAFTVYGVPVAKNAAVVNLGADWKLSSNVKLGASYNGQWASSAKDQAAKLSLDVTF